MRKLITILLALSLSLLPVLSVAELAGTVSDDYEPLWKFAEPYGFKLGGCFGIGDMFNATYMDFLDDHFISLTCTNETKAYSLLDQAASKASEDGMPRMNYRGADTMIQWAADHGKVVRGHVLVWDAYMTTWFFHEGYDDTQPLADEETMRARLASYIDQVITHFEEKFPGVIYCWDVVNEAIGDNANEWDASDARHLRTTRGGTPNIFLNQIGADYVEYSFLCARETVEKLGVDIRLFYNDYNMFMDEKRTAALALAESINSYAKNEDGTDRKLIDGIGMQGYLGGYGVQEGCLEEHLITDVKESIEIYSALGLEVQLTEMAVRNFEKDLYKEHDEFYSRLFSEVFMKANTDGSNPLTAVCIWGLVNASPFDKNSYVYKLNSPYGCLLANNCKINTCFDAVYHTLKGD
ncbi:MAG: endo-1,4-beta-xylanase [Clostridiales bacterium]|nr:endo-1,4-beta-xylanase [Clostridiales bacterium]